MSLRPLIAHSSTTAHQTVSGTKHSRASTWFQGLARFELACLATLLLLIGCSQTENNPSQTNGNQETKTEEAAWLLDPIERPNGPPESAESLRKHIQYAIQQQDRVMMASLFHRENSEGFKTQDDKIENTIDLLLATTKQNLTGIGVTKLDSDEIQKRKSQTFGMSVPVKLVPEATHEISFTYEGRVKPGESRPTSVNAGQFEGVFVIASFQVADE